MAKKKAVNVQEKIRPEEELGVAKQLQEMVDISASPQEKAKKKLPDYIKGVHEGGGQTTPGRGDLHSVPNDIPEKLPDAGNAGGATPQQTEARDEINADKTEKQKEVNQTKKDDEKKKDASGAETGDVAAVAGKVGTSRLLQLAFTYCATIEPLGTTFAVLYLNFHFVMAHWVGSKYFRKFMQWELIAFILLDIFLFGMIIVALTFSSLVVEFWNASAWEKVQILFRNAKFLLEFFNFVKA